MKDIKHALMDSNNISCHRTFLRATCINNNMRYDEQSVQCNWGEGEGRRREGRGERGEGRGERGEGRGERERGEGRGEGGGGRGEERGRRGRGEGRRGRGAYQKSVVLKTFVATGNEASINVPTSGISSAKNTSEKMKDEDER